MKTIILSHNEDLIRHLNYHLSPLHFNMEALSELSDPFAILNRGYELVLFDLRDFSRHWKPFVKLLREEKNKEQVVVILISPHSLAFEEAAKAIYLGVNGIIEYDDQEDADIFRLIEIIKRYRSLKDKRNFVRLIPDASETFYMLFTNPANKRLATGKIMNISLQGLMLAPLKEEMKEGLKIGDLISSCFLQVGENIITVDCKLVRLGTFLGFEFNFYNDQAHHQLFTYLLERPERKLKQQLDGHIACTN